jgi:thiosulfate oxidation carrier complex protein SoxZ
MVLRRRELLKRIGTAAATAAAGLGVLHTPRVHGTSPAAAFDARRLSHAYAALGIDLPAPTGHIRIQAPQIAENSAFVEVEIESTLDGTDALWLFADRNPWPLIAMFDVSRGALPWVSLRIRVAESSSLRVVARAAGRHHAAAREVQVVLGGCDVEEPVVALPTSAFVPPPIRLRARLAGEVTEVRALLAHPMENGLRKTATGQLIAEHFIRSVTAYLNGGTVFEAQLGRSVSADPLIGFKLRGARIGDKLALGWEDSRGLGRFDEVSVQPG